MSKIKYHIHYAFTSGEGSTLMTIDKVTSDNYGNWIDAIRATLSNDNPNIPKTDFVIRSWIEIT